MQGLHTVGQTACGSECGPGVRWASPGHVTGHLAPEGLLPSSVNRESIVTASKAVVGGQVRKHWETLSTGPSRYQNVL